MEVDTKLKLDVLAVLKSAGQVAVESHLSANPGHRLVPSFTATQSAEIQRVEQAIFEGLETLAGGYFATSETGRHRGQFSPIRWQVCPIDGIANFLSGRAGFAITLALYDQDECMAAWVYDPLLEKMAFASRWHQTEINGLHPSPKHLLSLENARLAIGAPALNVSIQTLEVFWHRVAVAQRWGMQTQQSGCTSLDIVQLIEGSVDAVHDQRSTFAAIAPPVFLAQRAGLVTSRLRGDRPLSFPHGATLAQPQIVDELLSRWPDLAELIPI